MRLAGLFSRPPMDEADDHVDDEVPREARVIAFANQKGGVAKTTSTLNLAVALSEEGYRVLVVDMDPQGNLTMSQGFNPDQIARSMFDVLVDTPPSLGLLTINALVASNGVIVPVQCEYLSLRGLVQLENTLSMIR